MIGRALGAWLVRLGLLALLLALQTGTALSPGMTSLAAGVQHALAASVGVSAEGAPSRPPGMAGVAHDDVGQSSGPLATAPAAAWTYDHFVHNYDVGRISSVGGVALHSLEARSPPLAADGLVAAAEDAGGGLLKDAAESCSTNSFTATTLVTMADGSKRPISRVRVGDLVLATDPETGETAARPVTALIVHSGQHVMVDVTLADGSTITTTDHHPFWDASASAFVYADRLRVGDELVEADGVRIRITGLRIFGEDVTAFNLTVDGIHTYYAGATPVLVHNSCVDVQALSDAAGSGSRNGLTNAGRAYQKHIGRPFDNIPRSEWNSAGQDLVDEALTNPSTALQAWTHPSYGPILDFRLPGFGVRFGGGGNFIGFLG